MMAPKHQHQEGGMTLPELLCVILIIGILASLYLGVISKAFLHVKHFLHHLGA